MKGIVIGAGVISVLLCFVLYCCLRVGSEEDRRMEKMEWKDRTDAGRKSG